MDPTGRPRPGGARQTLTEWQGRVQLQMAIAYHGVVLRPTRKLSRLCYHRANSLSPNWKVGRNEILELLAL